MEEEREHRRIRQAGKQTEILLASTDPFFGKIDPSADGWRKAGQKEMAGRQEKEAKVNIFSILYPREPCF